MFYQIQVQNVLLLAVITKSLLTQAKINKLVLNSRAFLVTVTPEARSLKLPIVVKLGFPITKEAVYF